MQQQVQEQANELVERLKSVFGEDRLVSVCVYGVALFGESLPVRAKRQSGVNTLVILKSLETADLEKATDIGRWWDKKAHALPLFLSEEEWRNSADIFALEYADIRDNHHVAYGEDLYNNVEIHTEPLRLVTELELHRKLLFLRQRLLLFRDEPGMLIEFMHGSIHDLATLFRGVLRLSLAREEVPALPPDVFRQMEKQVERFDAASFLKILASARGVFRARPAARRGRRPGSRRARTPGRAARTAPPPAARSHP